MIGCLMTLDGETFAVSQTGAMRPIPECPRRKIDREKAREFRAWIMENLSRCHAERIRLAAAIKKGPEKYYAVRASNRRAVCAEFKRWATMLNEIDHLDPEGMLP